MLIRVPFFQIAAAQVAEMRIAFEANHVVASMRLLCARIARRACLRVQQDVVLRRLLLGRDLELGAREAGEVFAMPACFADEAKGEGAVDTDGEPLGWFG